MWYSKIGGFIKRTVLPNLMVITVLITKSKKFILKFISKNKARMGRTLKTRKRSKEVPALSGSKT